MGNKGAAAQPSIRGHYLRQLQFILKLSFYRTGMSDRALLLSAWDGFYLGRPSSTGGASVSVAQEYPEIIQSIIESFNMLLMLTLGKKEKA